MIRVVVAEDHALVRQGISMLLQSAGGFELVAETAQGSDVELLVQFHKPDLLLLDLALSDSSGVEVARKVRRVAPQVRILVVTGNVYPGSVANAFGAGVNGFVLKHEQGAELLDAIRAVMEGRRYISPAVAELLADNAAGDAERPAHELLSERELQVFLRLAKGETIGHMADSMSLSVKTVSTYRTRMIIKLNVKSLVHLRDFAKRNHLL